MYKCPKRREGGGEGRHETGEGGDTGQSAGLTQPLL